MTDDDFERGRFRLNSQESEKHVEGKRLVNQNRPYSGSCFAEARLHNREMDVLEETSDANFRGACYHVVYNAVGDYRRRTRVCLRFGYLSIWLFHTSRKSQSRKRRARRELEADADDDFTLGEYEPEDGELHLGTPFSYKNFGYDIQPGGFPRELVPREICGRDAEVGEMGVCSPGWIMEKGRIGYDVGLFEFFGRSYRIYSEDAHGSRYQLRRDPQVEGSWVPRKSLVNAVKAGAVRRLGPVDGYRPMNQRC